MRVALALTLFLTTPLAAQQTQKSVAVTFDDIPGVAMACGPEAAVRLNRRLLAKVAAHKIPAAALVVTGNTRCGSSDLTRIVNMWLDAGHEVGSHTHSHFDLNSQPLLTYLADVGRAHDILTSILKPRGKTVRYFRFPGLHAGNTQAKKSALDRELAARRYRNAVVTIDNQEWVYAEVYTAAKVRNDTARIRTLLPLYFEHLDLSFAYYEALTEKLFNRQIRQVLLLHANDLNADYLDDVVKIMRRRGYLFISLDEAMADSAYRRPDKYVGPMGLSWLQRWAIAEGIKFRREPREHAGIR